MSSFKDTFTKDQEKEGLLGYDDTAFYYFAASFVVVIAVPWTYFVIKSIFSSEGKSTPGKSKTGSSFKYCGTEEMAKKDVRAKAQNKGGLGWGWWTQVAILVVIWTGLYFLVQYLGGQKEIKSFDPFEILEVSHSASNAEIKKAYRKLSLVFHPDKNPDDPLAASRFIQITKAHAALTDEVAKNNYEKYGNPDGPQTSKVGIGLPRFLLEKENHLMILGFFFFFLLFLVPMVFITYYQRTKNYAANGVMIETLQFIADKINESTRVKNCPELLAASAESRGMPPRPGDNEGMKVLLQEVVEHKKRQFVNHPIITKSCFLIGAHMQRLHHLLTPEMREDLDELLKHSTKITQAMCEISCMREWFFTAQAMIEFRRCLVQGLDCKGSQLVQVPHFTEETLKHCHRGKNATLSLATFLAQDPEQRKGLKDMEPQQVLDVEAFCHHVSDMELKAIVEVEDEQDIVVGDTATVTIQLKRKNLKEGEAMGPAHAPLFPEPKYEEWWIFLVESLPSTRIIAFERVRDLERVVEEKLRFPIQRPGKYKMDVHALCDSYAGIDKKVEINFTALQEDEAKREIIVHKEDEDLDLQPTLFQQFMGDLGREEESEEEEEGENSKEEKNKKAKPAKKDLGPREDKAQSETEGEDDSTKQGKDDDEAADDSSDSSSDSD